MTKFFNDRHNNTDQPIKHDKIRIWLTNESDWSRFPRRSPTRDIKELSAYPIKKKHLNRCFNVVSNSRDM